MLGIYWPERMSRHLEESTQLTFLKCITKLKSESPDFCNVRQSALLKFLKISIKNSKCAVSNKHIQDGRPGRYENRRGSKIKAKHPQKTPPPPRNVNVRDVITQKARESGIVPPDSKKTVFRQKSAK